jgi:hypothetical protein
MKSFNEHATVIYTDPEGNRIDTFVVFETDSLTGLTHINYMNLRVPAEALELHAKTVGKFHMPMDDAFSFEIFKKLKEKYGKKGTPSIHRDLKPEKTTLPVIVMAKAS